MRNAEGDLGYLSKLCEFEILRSVRSFVLQEEVVRVVPTGGVRTHFR